ncbi:2-oxoacid:acceptor oxidoreductase subunit alpha [candidate division CSSED10-310 bacterium]|uniref:2-oxoacid:acceptor oxidoreductase subunit alpha n=1 Tax=candidate division CSSED10-310 bacterium TaxID=2855610 RepID=A0ABV6YVT6_UNCC1
MKADAKGVLTGSHYLDGDHACAEGALAAGCRFFAGYPITPSTEVAERFAARIPHIGGIYIQMEDEMGSMNAVLGAAWAGKKSMTVTSGPGFSLMMENLGLGVMLETPCVLANVQRGGPSTGLPTLPGQSDVMQARWGSHGDYEIIALSPSSPQEAFEFTIEAFNLSERYRVPVLVMLDECVGHMTEKVIIPPADEIELVPRRYTTLPPEEFWPYVPDEDLVPPMPPVGKGYRFHITGLTHDYKGYPVMNAECQNELVPRLCDKILKNADDIIRIEEENTEDAEVILVSFGISSRVMIPAIRRARKKGIKVGTIRLITLWPFPEKRIRELAKKVKAFIMVEMNYGQMVYELERCTGGQCETHLCWHCGGWVHDPDEIYKKIVEVTK